MPDSLIADIHPSHRKLRSQDGYAGPRQPQAHFLPTLFDRLCDDEPSQHTEAAKAYAVTRQQLRQIILRDLMNLLNTSNIEDQIKNSGLEHVINSSVNYGISPLAGIHMLEKHFLHVEKIIRRAIINFEPRLFKSSLSIRHILKKDSHSYNILSFEISGKVHIQPYPMDFIVQSNVDLETSHVMLDLVN
ncbi:type VI secretion system baseplate subunit TssE [Comamonas composti]|uniref:type VI secretion system baseplate subunit TssE n=1 Tax=Comamonas composti TaxID=408558 RepID=UPI000A06D939|nr:type VI secretion system baseplate subunit TssE [Comamonas composti]